MSAQEIIAELAKLDRKELERVDAQLRALLAEPETETAADEAKPIWKVVEEIRKSIPEEEWKKLPRDGSINLDHYLYGHPKVR
jgi:hypothetical protein